MTAESLFGQDATSRRTEALQVCLTAHAGQKDKNGMAYWTHPFRVAEALHHGGGTDLQVSVALLHDVVEDSPWTLDATLRRFGPRVAQAVDALTRREGEPYQDYIGRVKQDPCARAVKWRDVQDNMQHWRLEELDPATQKRLTEKYGKALVRLDERG